MIGQACGGCMRVFAWSKRKREKFFLDRPIRAFRNGWTRLGAFGAGPLSAGIKTGWQERLGGRSVKHVVNTNSYHKEPTAL